MKKKILVLSAVVAMAMLASCSNTQTKETEDTTAVVETVTEEVTEEMTEEMSEEMSEEESGEDVSENNNVEIKFFNKTGEEFTKLNVIADSLNIEKGSLSADESVLAEIPKDAEELKVEFAIGEETTRLELKTDVLAGFNVVIEKDNADGFIVNYIGIDEEA